MTAEEITQAIRDALGGHRDRMDIHALIAEIREHQHIVLAACFGAVPEDHWCPVCTRMMENSKTRRTR